MGSEHEVEISKNLPGFVIPQYELGSDEKWTESRQLQPLNSSDSRLWIFVQKRPDFRDFCTYSSEASHIRAEGAKFLEVYNYGWIRRFGVYIMDERL